MNKPNEILRLKVKMTPSIKFYITVEYNSDLYELKRTILRVLRNRYNLSIKGFDVFSKDGFEILEYYKIGEVLTDNQVILIDTFKRNYETRMNYHDSGLSKESFNNHKYNKLDENDKIDKIKNPEESNQINNQKKIPKLKVVNESNQSDEDKWTKESNQNKISKLKVVNESNQSDEDKCTKKTKKTEESNQIKENLRSEESNQIKENLKSEESNQIKENLKSEENNKNTKLIQPNSIFKNNFKGFAVKKNDLDDKQFKVNLKNHFKPIKRKNKEENFFEQI